MPSLNRVEIIGHLGGDPEIRYTPKGTAVARFSVATNESRKAKNGEKSDQAEWHQVVAWGNLGESCKKNLEKGKQVYIEGKLQTRKWEDSEGKSQKVTEINASRILFLGSPNGGKDIELEDGQQASE